MEIVTQAHILQTFCRSNKYLDWVNLFACIEKQFNSNFLATEIKTIRKKKLYFISLFVLKFPWRYAQNFAQ